MPELKNIVPKRAPKFVTPKSAAPWDVASAITAFEHDAYEALVKEPAQAAGISPPPEIPGPGTVLSMVAAPFQNLFGGLTKQGGQGGGTSPEAKRGETTETKPGAPGAVATRGSL